MKHFPFGCAKIPISKFVKNGNCQVNDSIKLIKIPSHANFSRNNACTQHIENNIILTKKKHICFIIQNRLKTGLKPDEQGTSFYLLIRC
jgi:hypothetical protein